MYLTNSAPLTVSTLSEAVYRRLLDAIVSGDLPPGTPVTITQLAKQFEVSLMPVRDALKRLEAARLISQQKNRRIVVKELSQNDFDALLEIRLNLECLAARKAVKACTDETLGELEEVLVGMRASRDKSEFLEKNKQFHHILYRTARTPILQEIIEGLWLRLSPYIQIYAFRVRDYETANAFHQGILEGMRERNPGKVCKSLKSDLRHGANVVRGSFKGERGLGED